MTKILKAVTNNKTENICINLNLKYENMECINLMTHFKKKYLYTLIEVAKLLMKSQTLYLIIQSLILFFNIRYESNTIN